MKELEAGGDMNIIPVMNIEASAKFNEAEIPEELPILALRNAVLFPNTVIPITIGREKSLQLIREAYKGTKIIGAITQKDVTVEEPIVDDLYEIGTLARVLRIIEMPDGSVTAILQGVKRLKIVEVSTYNPYIKAKVKLIPDRKASKDDKSFTMLCESIKDTALQIIKLSPNMPPEAIFALKNIEPDDFLVNFVASSIDFNDPLDKMPLLEDF